MKLSNKGRYGVRALFDLALLGEGQAAQIRDIAERQSIPLRFLEQIFQELRRAGLVSSKRGPRGGYQLTKEPAAISLGAVLRALDGSLGGALGEERTPIAASPTVAITEAAFRELEQRVEACFEEVSLADLCSRAEASRQRQSAGAAYVYVI